MSVRKITTGSGRVRWRVVVDVGAKPDGRRDQRTRTFDTKREANAWVESVRTEVRTGSYVPDDKLTFSEFVTSWLAGRRDLKPASLRTYRVALGPFVAALGGRPLQKVTAADLDIVVNEQLASGLSTTTIAERIATVQSVLRSAHAQGLVRRNVAEHVVRPRRAHHERPSWTADQLAAWVTATSQRPDAAALRLLALGMRRGEVLGLRWADVDLDAGMLTVRATRGMIGGTVYTGTPKTPASRRTLHLDPETVAALRKIRTHQIGEHLRLGVPFPETTNVVLDSGLAPTHPDTFAYRVRGSMVRAGVPRIPVHSIRHTSVSLMLARGVPLHVVAAWHGHSAAVMLRSYSHVDADMLANASVVAASVLAGGV